MLYINDASVWVSANDIQCAPLYLFRAPQEAKKSFVLYALYDYYAITDGYLATEHPIDIRASVDACPLVIAVYATERVGCVIVYVYNAIAYNRLNLG